MKNYFAKHKIITYILATIIGAAVSDGVVALLTNKKSK